MKLGFGFYRHMLNDDVMRFAQQCGATHAVVHMCDYFGQAGRAQKTDNQPVGALDGWGVTRHSAIWTVEELVAIKKQLASHGLIFEAVENFDPAQWHDVLLDGPKRDAQLEGLKQLIRNVGEAGIPIYGYNFSLAGVAGRVTLSTRGGAEAVGLDGDSEMLRRPIPNGMVWNMIYDPDAPAGNVPPIDSEQLWQRYTGFLQAMIPVAEKAGVTLAAHPDDPPLPVVRGQPRLVYRHHLYQRLLDIAPSKNNKLEFCVGTLAEMQDEDLYGCIEKYSGQGKVGYVHMRNVRGKVPHYCETFIDDGDVDVSRVLTILHRNGFDGVIIPDHAPKMACDAPWYAGMAYAMGYLKATMQNIQKPTPAGSAR
jgi:mannonate dehydratase